MANKWTENTWEINRRNCPVCNSMIYVWSGTDKRCLCRGCGFVYLADVDYSKKHDMCVTAKNITTQKVFRKKFGIDKSFGIRFGIRDGMKIIWFIKNEGAMPADDKRLAYTINNRDLCEKIGQGKFKLEGIKNLMFQLKKIQR